jgi:pyruvate dehydrogenase E2 component (dihydrolipoamide acetyltransferase)
MTEFVMPSLGADMESGTVVEWLVAPGSTVKRGDVVVIVETHKGAIEVEIFEDGVISELCVKEGEEVPVGKPLARLTRPGEPPLALTPAREPLAQPPEIPAARETIPVHAGPMPTATSPDAPVERPVAATGATTRPKVSPAARRRAAERGINPATLKGTGIDGSVTLADVEVAGPAAATASPKLEARRPRAGFDPAQMRQAIAAAMSRSKREIPHYYLANTVDLGPAIAWLEHFNRDRPPDARLLPAVLLLKAAALALRDVPQLNGFWEHDAFRAGPGIHIGWAISLRGGGLVAPGIHDADRKSLPELMTALRDLVARARSGGLRSSELTDPTVTITSVGDRGADSVIGVIYPPQVAIIGFGRTVARPCVTNGGIEPRPLINVSLAADHRASDGHVGGVLLASIERRLQQPEDL